MLLATTFGVSINSSGSKALNSSKLALMKTIAIRANRSEYQNSSTTGTTTTASQGSHSSSVKNVSNHATNPKSTTTTINITTSTTTTTSNINNNNNTSRIVTKPNINQSSNAATTKLTTVTSSSTATATTSSLSSTSSSTTKIVPSASFLKTYTVPPTALHRSSEERLRSCSIDSLHDEKCHFKPIRPMPTTPWKCGSKSRGATVKAPKACMAEIPLNCDHQTLKKRVGRERRRYKYKIKPKLSANLFPLAKRQPSAFARLLLPTCTYTIPSDPNRIYKWGECANERQSQSTDSLSDLDSEIEIKKVTKKTQKSSKVKTTSKKTSKQLNVELLEKSESKPTNTKKRKAQTNPKLNETQQEFKKKRKTETEIGTETGRGRTGTALGSRSTPPLTRARIRKETNCKLYGPLA